MKSIKILGLDYESQGFPPATTNATEVGAILVEVKIHEDIDGQPVNAMPTRTELARLSTLIYDPSYPPQTQQIVELTGITDAMLRAGVGVMSPLRAVEAVNDLMIQADLVMAHNVTFDKAMYEEQRRRYQASVLEEKEWLCSLREVPYPARFTCKKLGHLALDHGMKMDHRSLHRATDDVELMLDLVLGNYHLLDVLAFKKEPRVTFKIDIPPPWEDGGKGRDLAVANGYRFEKPKGWIKDGMKKNYQIEQDNGKPFRVSVLA